MSNENELLRALIDALGFDIEKAVDYQPRASIGEPLAGIGRKYKLENDGCFIKDGDGNKITVLKDPIIEYKLTKRSES